MNPSVCRNPADSSKSFPGVRMMTARLLGSCPGPATRISIGSSAASLSGRDDRCPSRTATTRVVSVLRRRGTRDRSIPLIIGRSVWFASLPTWPTVDGLLLGHHEVHAFVAPAMRHGFDQLHVEGDPHTRGLCTEPPQISVVVAAAVPEAKSIPIEG